MIERFLNDLKRCSTSEEIEDWVENHVIDMWKVAYMGRHVPSNVSLRQVKITLVGNKVNAKGFMMGELEFHSPSDLGNLARMFDYTSIECTCCLLDAAKSGLGEGFSRFRYMIKLHRDHFPLLAVRMALSA